MRILESVLYHVSEEIQIVNHIVGIERTHFELRAALCTANSSESVIFLRAIRIFSVHTILLFVYCSAKEALCYWIDQFWLHHNFEMPNRQRGTCVFNASLQKKYPFLKKQRNKTNSDVFCEICSSNFCISNGGLSHIRRHVTAAKHLKALRELASSRTHPNDNKSIPTDSIQENTQTHQGTENTTAVTF